MNNKFLTKQPIQPLTLEGTAYQRGLGHGETLRSQSRELIGIWKADLSAIFHTGAWDNHPVLRGWTSSRRRWHPATPTRTPSAPLATNASSLPARASTPLPQPS